MENVDKEDFTGLLAFGISPLRSETGYGYIKVGRKLNDLFYEVEGFIEKPSLRKAQKCISSNYFWNSGIFCFSIDDFWKELNEHKLELSRYERVSYLEFFNDYSKFSKF